MERGGVLTVRGAPFLIPFGVVLDTGGNACYCSPIRTARPIGGRRNQQERGSKMATNTTNATKYGVRTTTTEGSVAGTQWSVTLTQWKGGEWQAEGGITLNGEAVHMCGARGRRSMAHPAVPNEVGAIECAGWTLSEDTIAAYAAMVAQVAKIVAKMGGR